MGIGFLEPYSHMQQGYDFMPRFEYSLRVYDVMKTVYFNTDFVVTQKK